MEKTTDEQWFDCDCGFGMVIVPELAEETVCPNCGHTGEWYASEDTPCLR